MPALELAQNHPRRNVRLNTLVRLRWLAITGQTVAVLGVVLAGSIFRCRSMPAWQ